MIVIDDVVTVAVHGTMDVLVDVRAIGLGERLRVAVVHLGYRVGVDRRRPN